jgi:glyoxylase-like metal-dependent hydrolase (beta-lactamase superfamily II)
MQIRNGIEMFEGMISHNLLLKPMVSNAYLLEDGDEVILFDPSCGNNIAKMIKSFIYERQKAGIKWRRAIILAGHSHLDHANNFYLSDILGASDTHSYVHERGFNNGKVMNEPVVFYKSKIEEARKYYNFYSGFFGPYALITYPIMLLDKISPIWAAKVMSGVGAIPWPSPVDGSIRPEPLKEKDRQSIDLGNATAKGWPLGNKVILATPGHSPCSISLLWPEKKAIFISDADWYGNPVFISSSVKDCISSLELIRNTVRSSNIDLLLPAHGVVKAGSENIIRHLDFCIRNLQEMRNQVLSAYRSTKSKNILRLTKTLVNKYSFFMQIKKGQYPNSVVFLHNMVTVCLKEEGIID